MKYYKNVMGRFVLAISVGEGSTEITEQEYNEILAAIGARPTATSGYTYKLRADTLEWELVELPPEPDPGDEDATTEDYEQALADLGVKL